MERLVIKYLNGTFAIQSRHSLLQVLPVSDVLTDEPHSGFWFEIRTAADQDQSERVLYRRIMSNPLRLVFEGPETGSEQPDGQRKIAPGSSPDRVEAVPTEQVFTIVIPKTTAGEQLVIFSSPLEPGRQSEAAVEIARIDLITD